MLRFYATGSCYNVSIHEPTVATLSACRTLLQRSPSHILLILLVIYMSVIEATLI